MNDQQEATCRILNSHSPRTAERKAKKHLRLGERSVAMDGHGLPERGRDNNGRDGHPTSGGTLDPTRQQDVEEETRQEATTENPQPEPRPVASLWKDVRSHLEGGDSQAPLAICPVCQVNELSIKGLLPSGQGAPLTRGMLVICGHMVCKECLNAWFRACIRRDEPVRCPVCRHELHFAGPGCRHPIKAYHLPCPEEEYGVDDLDYLDDIPRTLPEGAAQPERCNKCRIRRAMHMAALFEEGITRLLITTLEQDVGIFTTEEVDLIRRVDWKVKENIMTRLEEEIESGYPYWGGGVDWRAFHALLRLGH
ncbi:hypothetical protein VTK56DRAFT_904 [Thermocarpiscus australiensis]